MDYLKSFAISAAGMALERLRVDVAATNLANANTIQGPDGAVYQPSRVVARSVQPAPGAQLALPFAEFMDQLASSAAVAASIPEAIVEPTSDAPRQIYDPTNPFANERGFVISPSVNPATEMVTLMGALRAYEANVAALNAARTLAMKALEIGGNT